MDDKTCRLKILTKLKEFYDQDAHAWVEKETLMRTLELEGNVTDRNVNYLFEKGMVDVKWFVGGGIVTHITPNGIDFLETGQLSGLAILSPLTVHQEFHGPVGAVAGSDINVQMTLTEVLNKLAETIESDPKVPLEEKQSLIDRLKSLAQNDWIRSIGPVSRNWIPMVWYKNGGKCHEA